MEVTRRNLLKTGVAGVAGLTAITIIPASVFAQEACNPKQTFNLTAGQNIDAGNLVVEIVGGNLEVTYNLTYSGAFFGTLHLWAGTDISLLPKSGGGAPKIGAFPHQYVATGLTTYKFTIPLLGIGVDVINACTPGLTIYVVAHAEVDLNGTASGGGETAWGGNDPGPGKRWWFYASYLVCCTDVEPPPPLTGCETAYAKGGWVWTKQAKSNPEQLPSLTLTANRWGWAINLTSTGPSTYDIWAGAGLNKTSNGTKVGTLTVDWDGTTAVVTYEMSAGYMMTESHLYAGDARPNTIAPGQYGYLKSSSDAAGDTTHEYTVPLADTNGMDGVWLVAHAVVCAAPEAP